MSDELRQEGKNVTLVEAMDRVLPLAFDEDISEIVNEKLVSNGLNIKTGKKVQGIIGKNGKVDGVELEDGSILKADAVILSIGYKPNTGIASEAGLFMGRYNSIWTGRYGRADRK